MMTLIFLYHAPSFQKIEFSSKKALYFRKIDESWENQEHVGIQHQNAHRNQSLVPAVILSAVLHNFHY